MSKKNFSDKEIDFLIKNYPNKGIDFCCEKLKRTKGSITSLLNRKKIFLNKTKLSNIHKKSRLKKFKDYKVNPNLFLNIKTKEVAYFLGILWSDGHVNKKNYSICIRGVSKDFIEYKKIFDKIGKWNYYEHLPRKINEQPQTTIITSNYYIHDFLVKNDFLYKSEMSADKILSLIPDNIKKYFFRGIIDGDGCFYFNEKNNSNQFSITSTLNQNWKYIEDLFLKIGITKYSIQRRNEKSKSSLIRISDKKEIINFGNYIYDNYENDKIGLLRKYEKFLFIKNKQDKKNIMINLEDAKKIIKPYKINTALEYKYFYKNENFKNLNLPAYPDNCYKNKGWISWFDFLGKTIN